MAFLSLLWTPGPGGDVLVLQTLGAVGLTFLQISGVWLFVLVPSLFFAWLLEKQDTGAGRFLRSLLEALGSIPPLFVLLVVSFYGFQGNLAQTGVFYLVLYPDAIRQIVHSIEERRGHDYVRFAGESGVPEHHVFRWFILPSILSPLLALGEALSVRIVVFNVTLGFLGYGNFGNLSGFGEIFSLHRAIFLSDEIESLLVLVFLVLALLVVWLLMLALLGLVRPRLRNYIDGYQSMACVEKKESP